MNYCLRKTMRPMRIEQYPSGEKTGTMAPMRIGFYRLGEKLGEGGMGVVYSAQDELRNRPVAVKLLNGEWAQDPRAIERFYQEARIASTLKHPHLCAVYEFGEFANGPYMIMELLAGQTLRDLLASWPLALDRILEIAIQVADALGAVHGAGIIHRDVKSSNVFIDESGAAKVLDFGLAKPCNKTQSATTLVPHTVVSMPGQTVGTATNMSPEQAAGHELDQRSDIFSLGIVLYEMATGTLPFRGIDSAMILRAILSESCPPASKLNPNVPAALDAIIDKALQKDPDCRYQTMAELMLDLSRLRDDCELPDTSGEGGRGSY